jgi:hypothetical protein
MSGLSVELALLGRPLAWWNPAAEPTLRSGEGATMDRMIRAVGWLVAAGLLLAPPLGQGGEPDRRDGGLPRLVHLGAGAVVGEEAPAGWTYRVVRSVPRLASGALDSLPESAATTAALFRTVIATEVVRSGGTYRLARVGVGNAIPLHGREVVVTSEGPPEALDALGTIERLVLRAAEAKLGEGRLIARTPTFALLRAPAVLVISGRHRPVSLHYAFLVDPETGRQTTLLWSVREGDREPPGEVVALPPGAVFDAALDVAVDRHIGPIPITWSFAMASLPAGRRIAVPERVGALLTDGTPTAAMERALRSLAGPPAVP